MQIALLHGSDFPLFGATVGLEVIPTTLVAFTVATALDTTPALFAQQTGQGGTRARFYEKGSVRIAYQEVGSGFPLLLIAAGGLNSRMAGLATMPFNPIEEFKGEYRCIFADLRNAIGGESSGPLEIGRPWDSYADDHLGLMDHLGIDKFMALGFCIGGPFIWNLLKRAPNRVVAAVPAQPFGFRPEMPSLMYEGGMDRLGSGTGQAAARRLDFGVDFSMICPGGPRKRPDRSARSPGGL